MDQSSMVQVCERCGGEIPPFGDYETWCSSCGWNLRIQESGSNNGLFGRHYAKLGKRYAESIYQELAAAPSSSLAPRRTTASIFATVFAAIVLSTTLIMGAGGVALVAWGAPQWYLIAAGLLMMCLAWVLRPTFSPRPINLLARNDHPHLFSLTDDIAGKLRVAPVDDIVLDHRFNASMGATGGRGRPLLTIGLPLWTVLQPQQRVAVLAHELAHLANGDPVRGLLPHLAFQTLDTWHYFWEPMDANSGDFFEFVGHFVAATIATCIGGLRFALLNLMYVESQRAEYLADTLASRIAGRAALLGLLERVECESYLITVCQRAYYGGDTVGRTVIALLKERAAHMPDHEVQRLHRIATMSSAQIDATHPPTTLRLKLLETHGPETPAVKLTPEASEMIDVEFAGLAERLSTKIMDQYIPGG